MFLFAEGMTETPKAVFTKTVRPACTRMTDQEITEAINNSISGLPDDVSTDDVLDLAGISPVSRTAWHRSHVIAALIPPCGKYQAHRADDGKIRYRRIARA